MPISAICEYCHREYSDRPTRMSGRRHCSQDCRAAHETMRLSSRTAKCLACGKEFFIKQVVKGKNRFCSRACVDTQRQGTVEERFWSKVERGPDCWNWRGTIRENGYGVFSLKTNKSRFTSAHRTAWLISGFEIPEGMCVLHRCDNRKCVRPDHLFLGTSADNNQDRARKGRSASGVNHPFNKRPETIKRGSLHPMAKWTEDDVLKILALLRSGENQSYISRTLGIPRGIVNQISRGKAWRHVSRLPTAS